MPDESSPANRAAEQAQAWVERFRGAGPMAAQFSAFRAWLWDPQNLLAWRTAAPPPRVERYLVREEASGRFKVIDIWTGGTAAIAQVPQDHLSWVDADHTAQLLNRRAAGGDRSILQSSAHGA